MRNLGLTVIFLLGLSAAETVPAWAQTNEWTRLGAPEGGSIGELIVDPQDSSTLYATRKGGGIFKSTNSGATWRAVTVGLDAISVYGLAIDPQDRGTLYAAVWGHGIFKSTDAGESWRPSGLPDTFIGALAIDPQIRNTLYVLAINNTSEGPGFFRSTDGGTSWVNLGSPKFGRYGLGSYLLAAVVVIDPKDSNTLYAGERGTDGGGDGGMYKSTDGGITWIEAPSLQGCFFTDIRFSQRDTGTLFAPGWCGEEPSSHLFRTTDAGATWSAVGSGLPLGWIFAFAFDPNHPQIMYVGVYYDSVYRSVDGGVHWSAFNNGLENRPVFALALDHGSPYAVYAVTGYDGVFKNSSLLATNATLDPASVRLGSTFAATFSGTNLTDATYFDVRFRSPRDSTEEEALNWQQGLSATHGVLADTAAGTWTITGLRAHRDIDDHNGDYVLVSATLNLNPVVVTAVRFNPSTVLPDGSFSATFSGTNLTSETYFDVRFRSPGGDTDQVTLNWQRGISADHSVPIDTAAGTWTVTGIWAHENAGDHSSDFVPVSAALVTTKR